MVHIGRQNKAKKEENAIVRHATIHYLEQSLHFSPTDLLIVQLDNHRDR